MNDDTVFAAAPYIGAGALLVAAACRSVVLPDRTVKRHRPDEGWRGVQTIVRGAALALAALHVVLLSAPDAVLGWNRDERRLLLLEGAGVLVGAACLIAFGRMIWRHRPAPGRRHDPAVGDVVVSTLVGVELVSGLMLALLYRWASSWSVVTLTPYAVSLLRFSPRVELVASMPFLVRLHVFCAFAILAALPFATVGSTAVVAARRAAATAAAPVTRAFQLLGAAAGEWTRRRVGPLLSGNDEGS
jgi:nitrate reductase gamma subunit